MAQAMIGGLLANYPPSNITVSEPVSSRAKFLSDAYKIRVVNSNEDAISGACHPTLRPADVVVLAVKPQVLKTVASGIAKTVQEHRPLILTIAAGIRCEDLGRWLGNQNSETENHVAIVRAMPNTPALVGCGATGLFATNSVSSLQKTLAFNVLSAFSERIYWVDKEDLLDVVTALSGTGPAYFFLVVECLVDAATKLGLPRDIATGLAEQTCLGAGKMVCESEDSPAILRQKVTSPGGTTEAAIKSLESNGVRKLWQDAILAATRRSKELGDEYGETGVSFFFVFFFFFSMMISAR